MSSSASSVFPSCWQPKHPEWLQLYSMPTPNGQKIGIALEELDLPYEPHRIDILLGDQFDPEYVERVNPNAKIPAIIDPGGPGGEPIALMESGAILLYLAEKSGRLMPSDPKLRWETTQWLFFQVANIGPQFGQFGHFFKFARDKTTDSYGVDRFTKEVKRLLAVLDRRLDGRTYLVGEQYTVADIATVASVKGLDVYEGKDHVGYASYRNIEPWVERLWSRPAVQRGIQVCAA